MNKQLVKKIYKVVNSANVNFLIGAGLSFPFLDLLEGIEVFLNDKTKTEEQIKEKKKEYFRKVMLGNLKVIDEDVDSQKDDTLSNYKTFYKILNNILLRRENSILTKQVNVFTTNIDVFSEKALEETGIEFNDGFNGRFNSIFNLSNFKKSYFRKSLHYEKTSEIPVFNILKIHGSLTWKINKETVEIYLDRDLDIVRKIEGNLNKADFENSYKQLTIVNPTKDKFGETLLEPYYYDLLRIYSNELEKENSVLFVLGFSFEDKHLRDMTIRVAASNPTLKVYIFAHTEATDIYKKLESEAKNRNIEVIEPQDGKSYDLTTLNAELFGQIIPFTDAAEEKTREGEVKKEDEE